MATYLIEKEKFSQKIGRGKHDKCKQKYNFLIKALVISLNFEESNYRIENKPPLTELKSDYYP
jgi:hypothetical protein